MLHGLKLLTLALGTAALSFAACYPTPRLVASNDGPENSFRPSSFLVDGRIFDLVIKNARVIDPESGMDQVANIGIIGDTIQSISKASLFGAAVIDATGLVAAPGFIDIDTISYPRPDTFRHVEFWKLTDGVTTIAWLHDGAPTVEYIERSIVSRKHLTNWGFGIRVVALYERSGDQRERIKLLDAELARGGLAIGMSPEYAPFETTDELVDFARVASSYNLPVVIHTRHAFKSKELDGVREAIEIAQRSKAHVHILHIHSTGATFHMDEALSLLDAARSSGNRMDACVYPYSFWMTPISNPNRFAEGWREGLGLDYDDLYYVPLKRKLTKELFERYRGHSGLVIVPEDTISWKTAILPALAKEYVFFGSDGSCNVSIADADGVCTHPRDTGNFATALSLTRTHSLPLMTLLEKMTVLPARFLEPGDPEFARRGRIKIGAYADITLFDPITVDGGGTLENPLVVSKGIVMVVVNGSVAYRDGIVADPGHGRYIKGVRKR